MPQASSNAANIAAFVADGYGARLINRRAFIAVVFVGASHLKLT
jgi:hypothetical protein